MRTDGEPADFFYQLDDPAFLAERARLRSRLEHVPENAVGRPGLERLYEAMTEEFCRRARIAWTRSRLPAQDDVDRVRKAVGRVIRPAHRQRPPEHVDCAIDHAGGGVGAGRGRAAGGRSGASDAQVAMSG
jgi:hypothetical protein